MDSLFAQRVKRARRSVLRELLKLSERPGIISFAGGLPDPETFPRQILAEIATDEILNNYKKSLQYTTTEGKRPLRAALIDWLAEDGLRYEMDQVVITTASQQGLDLVAKTFFDPGDAVFMSLPTYLGAIQAFRALEAELVGVPLLEDGMDLDALQEAISRARAQGLRPKVVYVVPDFQNPTGITWSRAKREELLAIAAREDLVVVEDMPYRKLRYTGEHQPPVAALDEEGRVLVLFTFSKVLAAGLRLGAMAGPKQLIDKIVTMKQATDLCTSSLTQRIAARFMLEHDLSAHVRRLCSHYRVKRDAMLEALERYMPKEEGVSWTKPEGGLFLWVRLPEAVDAERMLRRALEHQVAFVIGTPFFVDGSGRNTMRLCFSKASLEEIEEGIRRLGRVVEEELAQLPTTQKL
ncbi:PLP-dependent aminotransferase family protein [Candidatus Bipolaricaulota bacterium]|nr:PLP-dependent aminotransferase family protein [Candidatus Bipolaricaulota bacterium]